MPHTCCVPECKTNYTSVLKREQGGKELSVFRFPKDENLKQKWLNAIPRANFTPSKTASVCCKHFLESEIIREDNYLQPDGRLIKIPVRARLKPNACPSIFPDLPEHLWKLAPTPRKSQTESTKEHMEHNNKLTDMFENAENIVGTSKIIFIGDLNEICRTCWCKIEENSVQFESLYCENKLGDIYSNVTSIKVNEDDLLPKKVCTACYDEIIKFYVFKTGAIKSEQLLTEALLNKNLIENEEAPAAIQNDEYEEDSKVIDIHLEEPACIVINTIESNEDKAPAVLQNDEYQEDTKMIDNNLEEPACIVNKSMESIIDSIIESNNAILEPCKQCGKVVAFSDMPTHMKNHTKERRFVCETCGATFSGKSNLANHKKTHLDKTSLKCEFCNKGFLNRKGLRMHKTTVHSNGPHVLCPKCGKTFKHKYNLRQHMKNVHGNKGNKKKVESLEYACSICGRLCKTKGYLQVHEANHTRKLVKSKLFLCYVCGKGYTTKNALADHLRVHTGERFSCKICQKTFIHSRGLKTHMLIHSGEKPKTCPVCNKKFRDNSNLSTHMRGLHSEERPYKCTLCSKAFKHRGNLVEHKRTHTGETRYRCDICQKGFYHSSRLKKHKNIHQTQKSVIS